MDIKVQCFERFSFVRLLFGKGPTLETLDYTIRIGGTLTFLYFDLTLNTAYAAHYTLI